MLDFVEIPEALELPDPGKRLLELGDRVVVLFHVAGNYYCIDDVCTHDGGPLGEGTICDTFSIACPRHGAKFDIRSGKALTMPATADTVAHEVKVENGKIFIKLRDE